MIPKNISDWCDQNGYTEPEQTGNEWRAFPPDGVMSVPLPVEALGWGWMPVVELQETAGLPGITEVVASLTEDFYRQIEQGCVRPTQVNCSWVIHLPPIVEHLKIDTKLMSDLNG